MGKRFYKAATTIYRTLTPRMKVTWDEEMVQDEPVVFIGNHAGLWGPLDFVTKFPLREETFPWFNADVADKELVPAYVRQDYWWKPGCKLEPLYDATLPYLAAAILPPIMNSVPGVKVYHDTRVMSTMRQSLRLLREGKHLLIFPEQPSGYLGHHDWINTGFLNIAVMYYRATGKALRFYPVHINHKGKEFHVAKSIVFDVTRTLDEQVDEIAAHLAKGLRGQKID